MKDNFLSKAVPRGTRTIWRYLSALFLLFTFSIGNVWGANTPASAGEYSLVGKKPGGENKFYKLGDGVYIHRKTNSSWDASMGMKIPSTNDNGVAVYLSSSMKVSALINKKSDKNAVNVELKAYPITNGSTTFDALEAGTDNSTTVAVTIGSTASYTLSTSFAALSSKAAENKSTNEVTFVAGYYYIVGTDDKGTTYLTSVTLAAASATAPAITAPTTDQSATYTVGDVITALEVTATGSPAPTYQWYSNSSASTTGAATISGATNASYTPANDAASDLYYYCVATNSEGNAQSPYFHVTVSAAVVTAPSFTSPASEPAAAEYHVGDVISALEVVAAGYPVPTLQWYSNESKSTTGATLITGAESASYTPSSAAVSDLYFYCVATNASGTAQSEYFHVTVAAVSYCAELVPATSGAEIAVGDVIDLQAGSNGGTMTAINLGTGNLAYNVNGLGFNSKSGPTVKVVLDHNMQVGTKLWIKLMAAGDKTRGLTLKTKTGSNISAFTCWVEGVNGATSGDVETFTYTVVAGDGLEGTNEFQLARNNSVWLQSLKVSNCGAELLDLSSAVDPVGEATVTLSATKVVAGGAATATYSIADPTAYDFDEWVISSGDATIADAHAATAAITMGTTASVITLKLKAASTKHTVTYYDGVTELGTELVVEGENPTAAEIVVPHKLGYAFAGWSTTDGGAVVALNTISVAADMPLYAVYNAVNCNALSGKIFEVNINVAPAANCTIRSGSGYETSADLIKYGTVSGGIAIAENSSTSNHLIITTTPTVKFAGGNGYVHISFDCALKVGDKIKTTIASQNIAYTTTSSRSTTNYFTKGTDQELTITSGHALENATEIYLWAASSNGGELTSLQVIRPEKFEVTFNMHGHGDAVDPQSVVEGGKVTKPTDPTASGWDFGGWFTDDTYGTTWDFENMTISAATEIHALWTVHSTSTDASLSDLQVNGVTVPEFAPTKLVYNVELPMGTTVVPTVVATPTDANAVATVDPCTLAGATITVVPESGVGDKQVYTINFSIATSKDIQLVFKTGTTPCVGSASTATQILSNNAAVSTYINQITFTNVEGAGDDGAEGSSLNVGKKAGNMFTLSAKAGFALQSMNFLAKIQDADCEYSINGGAWTTLTSTNTGADECYAPFSAAEVHEFRLRSTGASGVWIRNMQLTIIEACTPIVVAWDEEPVEFEVGKAGYAIAATANNGGTISYASANNTVIDVNASTGALTIAGLGSVALSASTPEGDGTTYCANGGDPIVLSKTVNTYYLVTFDGQNGEAADEFKYFSGDAAIAQPTDPSFPGHTFQGWFDAASAGNPVAFPLTPSASRTIYAQWTADCAGATITTQPVGTSYLTGRTATALVCEATAGAGGALTYEWFTCDDEYKANPVAATATPSTAVAGTFYYFCKVTEEGCAVEAFSDVATIVVADKDPICLAWVDVTANNTVVVDALKSLYAPEVSASNVKNTSSYGGKTGYKFNSDPAYIAIEGAPFKSGDIVEMFVTTTTADVMRVYKANTANDANQIGVGIANVALGVNKVALSEDANNLYLRRGDDHSGWNPSVAYVAVYRACAPILNKVTVAGVDGTPDNTNHVAIEVPFSTADAALDAIAYDWISNDAAWTAGHEPAVANAWEWGVENTVTLTDKDNDQSVYYVTISKAAASSDATLSALTVNGQAIALADGVFEYTFELPYGTSVVPTVAATPNHVAAVATVDPCTLSGATITVVPESGAGDQQVYTLSFVISKWKEVAIWDGSSMTEVATSPDATTGMAWTVNGFSSITNYNATCGTKAYTKTLPSGGGASTTRNVAFTVPAGYVAKFYIAFGTHSDGNNRGMFIGSNATKTLDATSVLTLYSNSRTNLTDGTSEIVGAGTYYLNPMESVDFYEIRAFLRPGYGRTDMLGNGVLGTVCVDHNVAVEDIQGVTVYELVGREPQYGKVAFDEIVSGELEAGAPYVFQAHGDRMVLFFGDTKVDDPVDKGNGMYGTFSAITLTELDDVYYFAQRALWSCVDLTSLSVPANRAYVMLSEIDYISDPNPAPGRRRILMGVNGETQAQGFENLDASEKPLKVMIDGTLYILRGEKVFDATGRLVK